MRNKTKVKRERRTKQHLHPHPCSVRRLTCSRRDSFAGSHLPDVGQRGMLLAPVVLAVHTHQPQQNNNGFNSLELLVWSCTMSRILLQTATLGQQQRSNNQLHTFQSLDELSQTIADFRQLGCQERVSVNDHNKGREGERVGAEVSCGGNALVTLIHHQYCTGCCFELHR